MQQVVRKYSFTTRGQVHEVDVLKHSEGQQVTWAVNVDHNLAGKKTISSLQSSECTLPFTLNVPGLQNPVDAVLIISSEDVVTGAPSQQLIVHQTSLEPWWTIEMGDVPQDHPVEVLGGGQNSPAEPLGTPNPNNNLANHSPEDASVPEFKDPRQQTQSPAVTMARKWWTCCTTGSTAEEVNYVRQPAAQSGLFIRPVVKGSKLQPMDLEERNSKEKKPDTVFRNRTCNDDIPAQFQVWMAEIFQE